MVTDAGNQQAPPSGPARSEGRTGWTRRRRLLGVVVAALAVIIAATITRGLWPWDLSPLLPGRSPEQSWAPVPGPTPSRPGPTTSVVPFNGTLRSSQTWSEMFALQWTGERAEALALSRSPDSWDHYGLSYTIDALTAAYLATGRTEYVDQGLQLLENVTATARPSADLPSSDYRDDYLGWVSAQEDGRQVPLYESYLWRYGVGLLRVVRQDPQLWQDQNRRSRYDALLQFAERNVFEKWWVRGADANIYRSRTHMAAHWALIALELSRISPDQERRRRYLNTVRAIDTDLPNGPSSLRRQLRMNPRYPAAYVWSDEWGKTGGRAQDVSHGNGVIAYVVAANAEGSEWTDLDMTRFVATFAQAVWPSPPRAGQPEGADSVDGAGVGNGWFSDGFVKLGRFDPQLQRRLETHDVGRSVQFLANNALNVAILACRGVAPTAAPRTTPACRLP